MSQQESHQNHFHFKNEVNYGQQGNITNNNPIINNAAQNPKKTIVYSFVDNYIPESDNETTLNGKIMALFQLIQNVSTNTHEIKSTLMALTKAQSGQEKTILIKRALINLTRNPNTNQHTVKQIFKQYKNEESSVQNIEDLNGYIANKYSVLENDDIICKDIVNNGVQEIKEDESDALRTKYPKPTNDPLISDNDNDNDNDNHMEDINDDTEIEMKDTNIQTDIHNPLKIINESIHSVTGGFESGQYGYNINECMQDTNDVNTFLDVHGNTYTEESHFVEPCFPQNSQFDMSLLKDNVKIDMNEMDYHKYCDNEETENANQEIFDDGICFYENIYD